MLFYILGWYFGCSWEERCLVRVIPIAYQWVLEKFNEIFQESDL